MTKESDLIEMQDMIMQKARDKFLKDGDVGAPVVFMFRPAEGTDEALDMIIAPPPSEKDLVEILLATAVPELSATLKHVLLAGQELGIDNIYARVLKVADHFRGLSQKDIYSQGVRMILKDYGAVAVVKLDEVWLAEGSAATTSPSGSVKDIPGRKEAIFSILEIKDKPGWCRSAFIEILREPLTLGPVVSRIAEDGAEGRFSNLFTELAPIGTATQ